MNRRVRQFLIAAVVLAGLTGAAVALVRDFHIRHFYAVAEGVLYRCGQPENDDWARLNSRYHIRTVVCLRALEDRKEDDWFNEEQRRVHEYGQNWVELPMHGSVPTREQADQFLAVMADPANHPVLIHCTRGKDRTGVMAALYRIHAQGWPVEKAIEEMTSLRDGERPSDAVVDFIRAYRPPSTSPDKSP